MEDHEVKKPHPTGKMGFRVSRIFKKVILQVEMKRYINEGCGLKTTTYWTDAKPQHFLQLLGFTGKLNNALSSASESIASESINPPDAE